MKGIQVWRFQPRVTMLAEGWVTLIIRNDENDVRFGSCQFGGDGSDPEDKADNTEDNAIEVHG